MFKLFWRRTHGAQDYKERDWRHDPLGHPVLLPMSARELADLPMVPEVPMRVAKAKEGARSGQDARQELSCRSAASR